MIIGVPRETLPGERRVALHPAAVSRVISKGMQVLVEKGAGVEAGYTDAAYTEEGARIVDSRDQLFSEAAVILLVRAFGADAEHGADDCARIRPDHTIIATMEPLSGHAFNQKAVDTKATLFALELIPRITRAQSMDVLSSQATIAGYKAVMLAANTLPRLFPMMMTAAGTLKAARVLVLGAGVAGLQAIASSRRLGAVVEAYDIRPVVKEQVESLGARFLETDLDTSAAEGQGGYAKEMDEEFYRKQRELMARVIPNSDVVITTAAIPGKKAPLLIPGDVARSMKPGSVIIDLAAETGGNCEITRAGETIVENGVTIIGPKNLPATIPAHASEMYARNISTLLFHLAPEGEMKVDLEDEVTNGTLMARGGEVHHPRVRMAHGLPELQKEGEG